MDIYQRIQTVQSLANAGHIDEALRQLREIILEQPDDVALWRLYVEVATHPEDRRFGLENLLSLDPSDTYASEQLARLGRVSAEAKRLPDYGIQLRATQHADKDASPSVHLAKRRMQALGIQDGDLITIYTEGGMQLPVIAKSGASGQDEIALNALAERMLAVRPGEQVALVPPENLVLALDVSASMSTRFRRGKTRLRGMKDAVKQLVSAKIQAGEVRDSIGVVSFETYARRELALTDDYERLKLVIEGLHLGGGTAMYEGLTLALRELTGLTGAKRIILLTDGAQTTRTESAVLELAQGARRARIVIDTIGLGKPGQRDYNEALLRHIAEITGGRFRHADDLPALETSFKQLGTEKRLLLTD